MQKDKIIGLTIGVIVSIVTWFLIAPFIHHILFMVFNFITGKDIKP